MSEGSASSGAAAEAAAAVGTAGESSATAPGQGGPEVDPFAERPELFVGGAFVGGLVLAFLMRRMARD